MAENQGDDVGVRHAEATIVSGLGAARSIVRVVKKTPPPEPTTIQRAAPSPLTRKKKEQEDQEDQEEDSEKILAPVTGDSPTAPRAQPSGAS